MTTTTRWIIRKGNCGCHPGAWVARLPGTTEHEPFTLHQLALRYAVDPRFRSRWKAGTDLARQYPLPITAAMRSNAL